MKTLFLTAGPITWASARMRAFWPAAYMGAGVLQYNPEWTGEFKAGLLAQYGAFVFQKVVDNGMMRDARAQGKPVYWDCCDPMWWFDPQPSRAVLPYVDGVVCSNEALRRDFEDWCEGKVKSHTIPDRLEMRAFPLKRTHTDVTPVRMIWFGLAGNRSGLVSTLANLERLAANGYPFELTVFDECPEQVIEDAYFTVYHARWNLDAENEVLASHDLALLPPYPGPWGNVKSPNRFSTAWACGLAATKGQDYKELVRLVESVEARRENASDGALILEQIGGADVSAREWERLLCK